VQPGLGAIVLDNDGVSRASTERAVYIRLKAAHADGRRVVTSAGLLAELLRGTERDNAVYRILKGVAVEPVSRELGEQAGRLIGEAGLDSAQSVDSMVAATAIAESGPVIIVTSDVPDLKALVAGYQHVGVVPVDKFAT
jgi:predicted nucleic acid-binding protein